MSVLLPPLNMLSLRWHRRNRPPEHCQWIAVWCQSLGNDWQSLTVKPLMHFLPEVKTFLTFSPNKEEWMWMESSTCGSSSSSSSRLQQRLWRTHTHNVLFSDAVLPSTGCYLVINEILSINIMFEYGTVCRATNPRLWVSWGTRLRGSKLELMIKIL